MICLANGNLSANEIDRKETRDISLNLTHTVELTALATGRAIVRSKLVNNNQKKFIFLPWNTPFDSGTFGDVFTINILEDGNEQTALYYLGRMVKRPIPKQSDLIIIEPGQSIEQSLDITKSYNFCSGKRYSLIYNTKFLMTDLNTNVFSRLESNKAIEFDTNKGFKSCVK